MKTHTQPPEAGQAAHFQSLDMLAVDVRDGQDYHSEELTEIQNLADGALLGYVEPSQAAFIVRACNSHAGLVEAVRLAGKNAESRLYMLPLDADEVTRKALETEVATYSAALQSAKL